VRRIWLVLPHNGSLTSWIRHSSDFTDEFVKHSVHESWIAAHDGVRRGDISVGVEVLPVENEAGFACELLKERPLGSAVAFTEWVDGVDLAEVVGQAFDEPVPGQVLQDVLTVQRMEDIGCRRFDELRQAKPTAFRDGDGPDLPSPVVYVSEDSAMDRTQMLQIEARHDRYFSEKDQRRVGNLPFRCLQFFTCAEPKLVAQHPRHRVGVRVSGHLRLPVPGDGAAVQLRSAYLSIYVG
jgi:hypothetical protein